MGKVVLTHELEAAFHGFQDALEVCNAAGIPVGLFLPLGDKHLANLEIPYTKEELQRRRQEQEGASLADFWLTASRS